MKRLLPSQPGSEVESHPAGPVTEKELSFKFRGGVHSLHLVETLGEWSRRQYERVYDEQRWQAWLELSGLPVPSRLATTRELAHMRELRRAIYNVTQAVRTRKTPRVADVETINAYARHPFPAQQLTPTAKAVIAANVEHSHLFGLIARDAIELFIGPYRSRIRECASPVCPVLFVDQSPRGDRQWCSTACGARRATARYRQRLKGEQPGDEADFCVRRH
jgi:predicted RNA-binding Zn ribbon-like protein